MDTKAIRQKILDLAIRGKLVPQDPNDEPASVLLDRIRAEKQQMVKDGRLKARDIKNDTVIFKGDDNLHYEKFQDGTVKCIEDEISFELPEGWEWCRLSQIITLYSGQDLVSSRYNNEKIGIPYITGASNLEGGRVIINRWTDSPTTHATTGDLLLTCKGSGVGKMAWCDINDAHIARQIMALRCVDGLYSNYLEIVISDMLTYITSKASGLIPGLSRDIILNIIFPLPSWEEQKRICLKSKEVLSYIDNIDDQKADLQSLIENTKSRILNLAIRGKLVPQDPNDEPASVLLERIRAEKEELIKQGKIKRDKKETVIFKGDDNSYYEKVGEDVRCIDEEIPFELPDNWKFVRLKSIWELLSGRDLAPSQYNDIEKGIPYIIGASNFFNGKVKIVRWTPVPQVITDFGDLLITCKGTVGEMTTNNFGQAHIARQIMAVKNIYNLNIDFLTLCMQFYIESIKLSAKGLIPGISREDILNIILPVPPEKHQSKILLEVGKYEKMLQTIAASLN